MSQTDSTAVAGEKTRSGPQHGSGSGDGGPPRPAPRPGGGQLFKQYKPEQGKTVRMGTFIGAGAIIAWGAKYLHGQLSVYEDIEAWWGLLITIGIPILFAVVLGSATWWLVYGRRSTGDFMIATEGEMKKVNWSTRREVIGSTKVVIMFTVLLALTLFAVDVGFQSFFRWVGVLKV